MFRVPILPGILNLATPSPWNSFKADLSDLRLLVDPTKVLEVTNFGAWVNFPYVEMDQRSLFSCTKGIIEKVLIRTSHGFSLRLPKTFRDVVIVKNNVGRKGHLVVTQSKERQVPYSSLWIGKMNRAAGPVGSLMF